MRKFDSLLYGNGLTIAILSILKEHSKSNFRDYLDCDTFIGDFITAKSHRRILREYLKYFNITDVTKANHDKARSILRENFDDISNLGFERWVSKNLFSDNRDFQRLKWYAYLLYNYWYHIIDKEILNDIKIKKLRNDIGRYVLDSLQNTNNIFTTNFDNILDDSLNPKHIHGRFRLPLDKIANIILQHYNDKNFKYKYLFGTNGLEKLTRLNNINKITQNIYDLDFLYDDSLELGSLLIFGIAFGRAEFISDTFLEEYPEDRKNKLLMTVDGHILLKLALRHQKKQLTKITIAYHTDADRINYKLLFEESELERIIEFKHCDELFNFGNAL